MRASFSGVPQRSPYHRPRVRPRQQSRAAFVRNLLFVWGVVAIATWTAIPQLFALSSAVTTTPEQRAATEQSVYYRNCNAARAAGAAPIYRGQPGYREGLDGDSDGIACEPYRY